MTKKINPQVYLKAAMLIEENKNEEGQYVCNILGYKFKAKEAKTEFIKLFYPSWEEKKEFHMFSAGWLRSHDLTNEQSNNFRILCLLLMYQITKNS